jgi:ABC-2 type transport system permease protein
MKRYIKTYSVLLQLNFSALFAHRPTLINHLISSILWGIFPLVSIYLVTAKVRTVYGWSREELYALTSYFIFVMGLFYMIFGKSFKRFSSVLDTQSLDSTLLKPIDSQFLISFWYTNFAAFFRAAFGLVSFLYIVTRLGIAISAIMLLNIVAFSILGLSILYSLWFILLLTSIWFAKAIDIRDFLLTINSLVRFPPEVYYNLPFFLSLVVLPLSLVIGSPTKILLGKANIQEIMVLFFTATCLFILSRFFWKFALRYYTSASG